MRFFSAKKPTRPKFSISKQKVSIPSDAYGTIEFLGGPHTYKAQYVKIAFDTDPTQILWIFEQLWHLTPPKLIISVHGGHKNFDLHPHLSKTFRNGLKKAAKSTNAWIFTPGYDTGVTKHVAQSLDPIISTSNTKSKVVSIGFVTWGMLYQREIFVGKNKHVYYQPEGLSDMSRCYELNSRHSYFVFVDDGTLGRYGSEIVLRRRLESFIMEKNGPTSSFAHCVPVVGVILEGGPSIIRTVLDYITISPKVPVVVCDGSGRSSNLLSLAYQNVCDSGYQPDVYARLLEKCKELFNMGKDKTAQLVKTILMIVEYKNMITIYQMNADTQEHLDYYIARALIKENNLSSYEQLMLALSWNRIDIAKNEIFSKDANFCKTDLYDAMMEALVQNNVDFVKLLIEKRVCIKNFLTIKRLEDLYNLNNFHSSLLKKLLNEVVPIEKDHHLTLYDIGLIIEKLIKHGYKSRYTSSEFQDKYIAQQNLLKATKNLKMNRTHSDSNINKLPMDKAIKHKFSVHWMAKLNLPTKAHSDTKINIDQAADDKNGVEENEIFPYPYSDLFIWAVLTQRQEIAICMWEHGEEALAKALVGIRLYKSMENLLKTFETEICIDYSIFKEYAKQFHNRAHELLDVCFRHNDEQTLQLLTYELEYWGRETCISLAVLCRSKALLAHPICQTLLADLWKGGLRIRHHVHFQVLMGLFLPPTILLLDFKSKHELKLQPKTLTEHVVLASSDSSSNTSTYEVDEKSDKSNGKEVEKFTHELKHSLYLKTKSGKGKFARSFTEEDIKGDLDQRRFQSTAKFRHRDSLGHLSGFIRSRMQFSKKSKPINWMWKMYEFYCAPITTFWSWSIKYIVFMHILIYVLLIKTPHHPSLVEWWLLAYVLSYGMEMIRVFIISAPTTFKEKWEMFFGNFWNTLTTFAVLGFLIGFGFRVMPNVSISTNLPLHTQSEYNISLKKYDMNTKFLDIGRIILALDSVLWVIKMLDYLSIHPKFGPYIYAAGKMVLNSIHVVFLLTICLLAFGLPRQSISFPNEDWHWILVRNIFYKPYFMVYGEVYAGEIDLCDDEAWDSHVIHGIPLNEFNGTTIHCVPGYWIPPILMTIFLIVSTFILLSMLIASFNQIFDNVRTESHQIWLFQRYNQVIQYECKPWIPPPFTPVYYVYAILKYGIKRLKCWRDKTECETKQTHVKNNKHVLFDWNLKLFLSKEQIENLLDFEEECMEELSKNREKKKNNSMEKLVKRTFDKTDAIYTKFSQMETPLAEKRLDFLETQIKNMDEKHTQILNLLTQMSENHEIEKEKKISMGGQKHDTSFERRKSFDENC